MVERITIESHCRAGQYSPPIAIFLALSLLFGIASVADSHQLDEIVGELPDSIQQSILERPDLFNAYVIAVLSHRPDLVALVDRHSPLSPTYVPSDLVAIDDYGDRLVLLRPDMLISRSAIADLLEMSDAAAEEGIVLEIASAYRSYDYQAEIYDREVRLIGLEQASREVALPGASQHQLGTTIDFGSISLGFADTEASRWLEANASSYGFSLSYPSGMEHLTGYIYESWHYRYIGKLAAALERQFFDGKQYYMLNFIHKRRDSFFSDIGFPRAAAEYSVQ